MRRFTLGLALLIQGCGGGMSISSQKAADVSESFAELATVASEMEARYEDGLTPEEADANRQDAAYIREVASGNASDIKRGVVVERLEKVGGALAGMSGPAGVLGGLLLLGTAGLAFFGQKKKPKRGSVTPAPGGNDGTS